MCTNLCEYAYDEVCDDGGPGSEFGLCDVGSDCADCGPRIPAPPPVSPPPPTPSDDDGSDDDGDDGDGGGGGGGGPVPSPPPAVAPPPPPPLSPLPPYAPGARPIDGLASGRSAAGTVSTVFLALLLTFTVLALLGATVRGLWLRRRTPEGQARWRGVAWLEELLESISWPTSRSAAVPGMASRRVRSRTAPPTAWPAKAPREESVRLAESEESQLESGGVEAARRQTVVIPPGFERDTRDWHFIDRSNEEHGPVTAAELLRLHERGDVHDLTYVWHEDQGDWMPLSHACSVWLQPADTTPRDPDRSTSMPPPKPTAIVLARTIEMPTAPQPDGYAEVSKSATLRLGESAESSGGFHTQPEV